MSVGAEHGAARREAWRAATRVVESASTDSGEGEIVVGAATPTRWRVRWVTVTSGGLRSRVVLDVSRVRQQEEAR